MIPPLALGALASVHELILQLAETLPARDFNRRFEPGLPSAAWLVGRAVYLELALLRSEVMGDDDLAGRVRQMFESDEPGDAAVDAQLPPQEHLLGWAGEMFDRHLTWLANPGILPQHPLLTDGLLVWHMAQRLGLIYERLLAVMNARSAARDRGEHRVETALEPRMPGDDSVRVEQGHYRIGAREGVTLPNEQPPQVIELHAFRIGRRPVSNAEYLAFVADGGYRDRAWWDQAGRDWLADTGAQAPWLWRRDAAGNWYGIGTNGPLDLHPEDLASGLSAHEARAYAAWAAARGQGLSGAVPQHEYQWEVAARLGMLELTGRVWEWCANPFRPYPGYQAPQPALLEPCPMDDDSVALRGGCLHTQPSLRRTTLRQCAAPGRRDRFTGVRLVMPPGPAAWE